MASSKRGAKQKLGIALLWMLTVLDAAFMALAGWSKFGNPDTWTGMFEGWGYPAWFSFVIGAGELGLAIVMLAPRFASYAATGLIVIMLGALGTVLVHSGGRMGPEPPLIHLALLTIILVSRWKDRWRPHDVEDERLGGQ